MNKGLNNNYRPLAERMRPTTLEEFYGQEHLLGKNCPIRLMIENDNVSSFILWGPPGTGKTTIAKIISENTSAEFFKLNAVSSGVKDVRKIIDIGKNNLQYNKKTILFIDEIHRFNKSQQDALLASVEAGEIILIGATTENPSFEVISALRSRMRTYILNSLSKDDLNRIIDTVLQKDEIVSSKNIKEIDRDFLFFVSGGDARNMLNILDLSINYLNGDNTSLSKQIIEKVIQQKNTIYDKNGEEHYNLISAFIKSIRGSDPDAAIYWLARMLQGGEDPIFIARRLIILASEDVGNASPNGLVLAEATFNAVHKIGMPEARILLAQCVTYLASAPKSNASYMAINKALSDVSKESDYPVPIHLRNAPTKLMKEIGYGKEYKYAHDFENSFVEQNYLPEEKKNTQYYFPKNVGQEKGVLERLKFLWKGIKKY